MQTGRSFRPAPKSATPHSHASPAVATPPPLPWHPLVSASGRDSRLAVASARAESSPMLGRITGDGVGIFGVPRTLDGAGEYATALGNPAGRVTTAGRTVSTFGRAPSDRADALAPGSAASLSCIASVAFCPLSILYIAVSSVNAPSKSCCLSVAVSIPISAILSTISGSTIASVDWSPNRIANSAAYCVYENQSCPLSPSSVIRSSGLLMSIFFRRSISEGDKKVG